MLVFVADPIAVLDTLLVDDPASPDLDEAMAVAGDLLQSRGHIRGELIALELMLRNAATLAQRKAASDTLESYLAGHESHVFGSLHALRHRRGALRYELLGGRVHSLVVDKRRIDLGMASYRLQPAEFVQVLVGSPPLRHLRSLQLRVAKLDELVRITGELRKQVKPDRNALEMLLVSTTTRPIGHRANATPVEVETLRKAMPKLWCMTESGYLVSLLDPRMSDEESAHELDGMRGRAMTRDLRVLIGRGLCSGRPETTKVACEHLVEQGASARVFLPILHMLLRPQVSHAAAWIVPMLPRMAAWALELRPQLATITGASARYGVDLRRNAGLALRGLSERHG
jgi:hypothetical protein